MRNRSQLVWMLWIVAVSAISPGAWAQTISFAAAPSFSAGTSPTSVASGSFSAPNSPDLAVTNQHGVSVLISDQHGGYLPRVDYNLPSGSNPQSVATFKLVGSLDNLAVVNQGTGTVTIMLNNGDGTFKIGQSYPAGTNPRMVVSSDFNSDGAADLAIVDSGAGPGTSGVSVLIGKGDGTFQAAKFTAAGTSSISLVAIAFDSDQYADVLVANSGSDDIDLLIGKGDGTFQPPVPYKLDRPGISVSPTSITVGDFNGDGLKDVAVSTPNVKGYAVLLGMHTGGVVRLGPPAYYTLDDPNFVNNKDFLVATQSTTPAHPNVDLILADYSADHVTVLLGAGDGTFPKSFSYAAGPSPTSVAFVFNPNGFPNLAISNNTVDGVVTVLPVKPDGTLQAAPLYRSAFTPQSLAVGDLDNDGALDIVAASSYVSTGLGSGVTMLANGSGGFKPPVTWTTEVTTSVALGDFNGDGKLDLVSTHPTPGNGNVSVWQGNGDGTFQAAHTYNAGTTPDTVAVADLNGDGYLDLVVGNHDSGDISVLLGKGDGTFQFIANFPAPTNGTPDSVVVTDFNGDGKPDIVAAISGINATTAALLLGNGDGTFQAAIPLPAGFHSPATLQIAAGDFNGDGKSDVALTDGTTLSIILGSGVFEGQVPEPDALPAPTTYTLIGPGAGINGIVAAGDFDGDGKLDLAVTTRDGIFFLSGTGDGKFQAPVNYAPFLGGAIAVGDFDGNGTPDVVAADSTQDQIPTDTVAVLLNSKASSQVSLTVDTSPTGIAFTVTHGSTSGSATSTKCAAAPCTYKVRWGDFFQISVPPVAVNGGTRTEFDSINDAGPTTIASNGQAVHTVLIPAVSSTVVVKFTQQYQLTIAVAPVLGGAVAAPASGGFYDGTQFLTATPRGGWNLVNWTGVKQTSQGPVNVTCVGNPCAITVDGPTAWTANFTFVGQKCDTNADSQLTVADVNTLIREALGLAPPSKDLDSDGGVNIVDAQLLLNATLGNCPPFKTGAPLDWTGNRRQGALLYDPTSGQSYTALSNGDGTYHYVGELFTPAFDTLRSGDFNGDGGADLVVYNSHTALAYIGFGNGDGTFAFQSLFWSPGYDVVESGDLNGDGKTDVVLYNSSTGTLYSAISKGESPGNFTYVYNLVSTGFTFVRLADFTGDGRSDLFLYNANNGLASLGIGDGTGLFTFHSLSTSPGYTIADVGDLNGDGKADIILYNPTNGNAATGISDGLGGFTFTPLGFSPGFTSVRLADYTGDGKADVTVYNRTNAAAYFGTGTGTGNFSFQSLFWSPGYDWVVPVDVNGDGRMDVILYNSATGTEYTGISNGDGTFAYTYQYWGIGKVLAR